jgi:vacuolar-type H+-ATPase subunit H
MDELVALKSLEAELSSELERARKDAQEGVNAALAAKAGSLEAASRDAESATGKVVSSAEAEASDEAKTIAKAAEDELGRIRVAYGANVKRAVDCVLDGLGV